MKEMKRYGQKEIDCFNGCDVEEQKDGRYVKYTDHKEIVETMQKRIEELENKEVKGFVVFAETGFTFKQISIPFNTEEDCDSFIETMEGTMAYKDTKMMYCNVKMIGWQPID